MAGGEGTPTAEVLAEPEMDLDFSRWGTVPSFEFAFNSENFSDRLLQLEVVACDDVGGQSLPDPGRRPKERGAYGTLPPPQFLWLVALSFWGNVEASNRGNLYCAPVRELMSYACKSYLTLKAVLA